MLLEVFKDCLIDTLKMIPILLIVYIIIEFIQIRISSDRFTGKHMRRFGPVIGAIAGCLPQCGLSAAATELYNKRMLTAGTLSAVFIATSDEAIPVMLSNIGGNPGERIINIIMLIAAKIIIAVAAGYFLDLTLFKNKNSVSYAHNHKVHSDSEVHEHYHDCGHNPCECDKGAKSIVLNAFIHTLKISLFVFVTLLVIGVCVSFVGEENISAVLLKDNFMQPFITALIGIIPGCATSVLITELYMGGTLAFGSAVAGLCTGAGFGYILLFRNKKNFKNNIKIIVSLYIISVICGVIINFIV